MAEGKKGFILYCDQRHAVDLLPDEIAGKLFKLIFSYVNDEKPEPEDLTLKLAFEPIKWQLKRDLKKYEGTKQARSLAGRMGNLKRWHPDLYENVESGEKTIELAETIAKGRTESQTDRTRSHPIAKIAVNVNDNDNDNDNNIEDDDLDFSKNEKHMMAIVNNKEKHQIWIETNYRTFKLKKGKLGAALQSFNATLVSTSKVHPNIRQYKNHFHNWMNKQVENNKLKELQIR